MTTSSEVPATAAQSSTVKLPTAPAARPSATGPAGGRATHWGAFPKDWDQLERAGLGEDLLPIVQNPHKEISPRSSLRSIGKMPSQLYADGVGGFKNWPARLTSSNERREWRQNSDYGICVVTRRLRALDIDVSDEVTASAIAAAFCLAVGMKLPERGRSNSGKRALFFALEGELPKRIFTVQGADRVEFLGNGQQAVLCGTHSSGVRYEWREGLPDSFPVLPLDAFERGWSAIVNTYADAGSDSFAGGPRRRGDNLNLSDETADWLLENYPGADDLGDRVALRCPKAELHSSDNGPSETIWFRAGTQGHSEGRFDCRHESCGMTHPAFIEHIKSLGYEEDLGFGDLGPSDEPRPVSLSDFWAYREDHSYICTKSGASWPAASVNAEFPPVDKVKPSVWLDEHRAVHQKTWLPGEERVVEGRALSDDGWTASPGWRVFNLYKPPLKLKGEAALAGVWVEHVRRVYPDEADHIIKWLAHRVQRPAEKINHALVLGGNQGIGKDTLLEPVKAAIGASNFVEVSPSAIMGRFNGFVKSVILRVSEARDLGDVDRFKFYDHMKTLTAAPPDVLSVEEKFKDVYPVVNVCGIVITSNHKAAGIYLPADDRRHFVAWSHLNKEDFDEGYWRQLYGWFERGGTGHVAAYLRELHLGEFDAKAPPPKTPAFWEIAASNATPEDAELADALDALGNPDAVTIHQIMAVENLEPSFFEWLRERRNNRKVPYRMEQCGYVPVRNDTAKDGLFVVAGRRCAIYARADLSTRDRVVAARELADRSNR